MNHEHKECEHEIKYCSKCDVCYCILCGKEWSAYTLTIGKSWPPYVYTNPNPYAPDSIPQWQGDGIYPGYTYKEYPTITVNHTHEGSA